MLLLTLVTALTASQTLDLPWEMSLINVDGDCPQLCGNWSALFLSDSGCKGMDMVLLDDRDTASVKEVVVRDTLRFCPNKDVVEAWSIEKELVYAAMYLQRDGLSKPESEIFRRMTYEREMKLSVHPWQKFSAQEISDIQEKRRIQAKGNGMKCRGQMSGKREKVYNDGNPVKVKSQFQDDVLQWIQFKFPNKNIEVGQIVGDGKTQGQKLPACTTIVFLKYDGTHINGMEFLSQGKETRFYGSDTAENSESYIYVAPAGSCLGNIKIRGDDMVNRLCIKFNGEL